MGPRSAMRFQRAAKMLKVPPCRICNRKIVSYVKQVISFAFHDSRLILETCEEARALRKIVTLFYMD